MYSILLIIHDESCRLACVDIVTGHAHWITSLDTASRRLAFNATSTYWHRSRFSFGPSLYVLAGKDKLCCFTGSNFTQITGSSNERQVHFTIRDINTGTVIAEESCDDQYKTASVVHHRRPDHILPHPNGKEIIAALDTKFYIYSVETAKLIKTVQIPAI